MDNPLKKIKLNARQIETLELFAARPGVWLTVDGKNVSTVQALVSRGLLRGEYVNVYHPMASYFGRNKLVRATVRPRGSQWLALSKSPSEGDE